MAPRDDRKSLDLDILVEATANGPIRIQRTGSPGLVIMREETYMGMHGASSIPGFAMPLESIEASSAQQASTAESE